MVCYVEYDRARGQFSMIDIAFVSMAHFDAVKMFTGLSSSAYCVMRVERGYYDLLCSPQPRSVPGLSACRGWPVPVVESHFGVVLQIYDRKAHSHIARHLLLG